VTVPLSDVLSSGPLKDGFYTKVSLEVLFFKVGTLAGKPCVCVVHVKSGLSTKFKLMELVACRRMGHFRLDTLKEFVIPTRVAPSVHFFERRLVIGASDHDFKVVDPETLNIQAFLSPNNPITFLSPGSLKCLTVYPVDNRFLVCYTSQAVYLDPKGQLSGESGILWKHFPIVNIAFRYPYLLAFSQSHLEVWHASNGILLQNLRGTFELLSAAEFQELFIVRAEDNRVLGLQLPD